MRQQIFSVTTFAIILSAALSAQLSFAESCDLPANAPGSEENRARLTLEKKMNDRFASDGSKSAIYFVLVDKKNEFKKDPEILRLAINPDSDRIQIPADMAKKLSQHPEVMVFNRAIVDADNGMSGHVSSLYFVPYSEKGLSGMKPKTDFTQAVAENRKAGSGCTWAKLQGKETLTVIYHHTAAWADKVTDLDRFKELDSRQNALLLESFAKLNKKLGITTGANRSPASGNQAPTYSGTQKKLPAEGMGTGKGAGRSPASVDTSGGN